MVPRETVRVRGKPRVTGEPVPVEVGPGDGFVLRPGFKGTWEVVETTRKEYVIRV